MFESDAPTPSLPKAAEPPHGLPPPAAAPSLPNVNVQPPNLPPSIPSFSIPPPSYPSGVVPALPPSPPNGTSGHADYPSPQLPEAPLASPPRLSPPPTSPEIVPVSPPKSDQPKAREAPSPSTTPVSSAPAPWRQPQTPPPTYPVTPKISPSVYPVPVASSPSKSSGISPSLQPVFPRIPPSSSPDPHLSFAPPPLSSVNWKGTPVAATPNGTSNQHSYNASSPLLSPKAPARPRFHSPALQPPASFRRHYHRNNHTFIHIAPPPVPTEDLRPQGPPPSSSGSPTSPSPPPPRPLKIHESPPPFPLMRKIPPFQALPPPPPNQDCTSLTCSEPLTNAPPGSPCICVLPIQVGLRINVALYNFFPLVSEFASEIAAGVFLNLSQVRIMGANAAGDDPEKTIVLTDLVPLGENFDSATPYLTYKRFWLKEVAIKSSFFGDYEVLYVRYPGLPPSPPSAPSYGSTIGSDPYSARNNNGAALKPIGVDVKRNHHKRGLSASVMAIIVLSASVVLLFCCATGWILVLKKREKLYQVDPTPPAAIPSLKKTSGSTIGSRPNSVSLSHGSSLPAYNGSAKSFSLNAVERATDSFSETRVIGEGGFGRVYSGMLEDGTEVAVKVLKRADQQGGREFLAEVEMLSRLHHRNLVKLIGICTEEHTRCLLYELVPNGSVESHLHGVHRESSPLDWGARLRIALGAARGLAYLHEDSNPRVIHRDFKSSNILLEHDFTPKVSDFGLARTALDEDNKHISTRVMGTFGYVAPEYAMTGHLLVKSDVYSYGVVLLELLTSRKPVDMSQPPGQENLVTWARPLLTSKEGLESIIDPTLGPDFLFDSISKVAAIASMCVQPEVSNRPFMGEVVQALKLICNERDETNEIFSRSSSADDLSVEDAGTSSTPDHSGVQFPREFPVPNYPSDIDVERGFSTSDLLSSSARYAMQASGSHSPRRNSNSGHLSTGKTRRLWQKMRHLSGGTVSEHGGMFRLWHGSR
ncbi:OLC1v1037717C1 [Oldenlandia corymbosa var. corymbosa]|nr:OLC1v1037717C1 [Oldenlandia corymbosa var. corymbosa]